MFESIQSENKYLYILGDFNVDVTPHAETTLATEEFKNIFSSYHLYPLINKPTRETKTSNTIIDNIYCNIPYPLDTCDVGILRPFIADHNVIFCIMKMY